MNIADYIEKVNKDIYKDSGVKNQVSDMKINIMLFMIYGAFYNKYKKSLWKPHFEAGKYCPVEKEYNHIGWLDNAVDVEKLTKPQKKELERMVKKLLTFSTHTLADACQTMEAYKDYKKVPIDGVAVFDKAIPAKAIKECFKRIWF